MRLRLGAVFFLPMCPTHTIIEPKEGALEAQSAGYRAIESRREVIEPVELGGGIFELFEFEF